MGSAGKTCASSILEMIVLILIVYAGFAYLFGQIFPRGPRGPQGERGFNGTDGIPGTNGKDGIPGINGKDGIPGTNGKDGIPGTNGKDGIPGTNGKDGIPGTNGKDGIPGTNGKDGIPGTNGKDGIPGTNGTNGKDGIPGTNGKDGIPGTNGKDGKNGTEDRHSFIIHSQSWEIPKCPRNIGNVIFKKLERTEGYSLFHREGRKHKDILQPNLESCRYNLNDNLKNKTYWLRNNHRRDSKEITIGNSILSEAISRCVECESSHVLKVMHSQEHDTIPSCHSGYESVWVGYSFRGIHFPTSSNKFQDLKSPTSCLRQKPHVVCARHTQEIICDGASVMSHPTEEKAKERFGRCRVCVYAPQVSRKNVTDAESMKARTDAESMKKLPGSRLGNTTERNSEQSGYIHSVLRGPGQ